MGDAKAPELSMDHHYFSPSMITGRISTAKSYNDKAREALPGLGKWSDTHDTHGMFVNSGFLFLILANKKQQILTQKNKIVKSNREIESS